MIYVFDCPGREHEGPRQFERFFHGIPNGPVIDKTECKCGAVAKRRFDVEMKTQAIVGLTPISHSTSTKGSVSKELEFAFGEHKKNPDGTVDTNHRPFRDTGELDRFMNGANDLGKPKISQTTGKPLMRADGSYVREGAKLIKYDKGAAPSRTDARRFKPKYKGVEWGGKDVASFGNTNSRTLKD